MLPLPGLVSDVGEPLAADLSRLGIAGSDTLEDRLACVSLDGMIALKSRIASYFVRHSLPQQFLEQGARAEWEELNLWEQWIERGCAAPDFQTWLDEGNPRCPGNSRRATLVDYLTDLQFEIDSI